MVVQHTAYHIFSRNTAIKICWQSLLTCTPIKTIPIRIYYDVEDTYTMHHYQTWQSFHISYHHTTTLQFLSSRMPTWFNFTVELIQPSLPWDKHIGLQLAVNKSILKCVTCRKTTGKPYAIPDPPPSLTSRVSPADPFAVTGVDFTGTL